MDDNLSREPGWVPLRYSPASEKGRDYETQIYIGTKVVNAVLSAAIILHSPLKFAISGMTRSTPVTSAVHDQNGNYFKLVEVSIWN